MKKIRNKDILNAIFFFYQSEQFQKEKQLVKDAAEFLVLHQIPTFVSICIRCI